MEDSDRARCRVEAPLSYGSRDKPMRNIIRIVIVTLGSAFLGACSFLNQVHFHKVEPLEPIVSTRDGDRLVFVTDGVCVLVSEGYSSKSFDLLTVGPGVFPIVLPIIPVGLPDKTKREAGFVDMRIQFYARGQDDRKLAFDPHYTTIEYDDGTILPPRAVMVVRGIVSTERGYRQGLLSDPEHVAHTTISDTKPIDEIKVPVLLQDWSSFNLVFPEKKGQINAVKLNLAGLTQNGKVVPLPVLKLSAVSEVRFEDWGTTPDGERINPGTPPFVACRELLKEQVRRAE